MSNEKGNSIVAKMIDDIKADASAQYEIDKANFSAVKADARVRFEAATAPNEDFNEFREAKGLKEKAVVVGRHLAKDAKERRAQSRKTMRKCLENKESI